MGIYSKYLLPKLIHFACSTEPNMRQREKVVPLAKGRVLEIGIGSGLNLPFYDHEQVDKIWGLDPSPEMISMACEAADELPLTIDFINRPGEEIPLDANSMDTVVVTYALCTIPDVIAALRQMARVLKPGGQLIFCEHGLAPDARVRRWQNRLNPIWKKLGGGCNMNRDIPAIVREGGFKIKDMETMYLPGWRPASFNCWGTASIR
ncbi:MAG: class I SAM-dependent methyltransferase [Balneolaceae bacterium]|nr:class I SAM-dependent methyltransferase [Balneolaceae bacterium]